MKRTLLLVILDGWGIGREDESNPIHVVSPQTFASLGAEFPVTSLQASGISVGLPWGEVGNSEVGHLTIGAGKVLYQHYPRITIAIKNGSFFENPVLKNALAHARDHHSAINFVGLLSRGNVHASLDHILALIAMAERENIPFKLHLFADGKDSAPGTLIDFLKELPREKISTLTGRYYAMDREQNWSLTEKTYAALFGSGGRAVKAEDLEAAIDDHYKSGTNEEFLPPLRLGPGIMENDAVVFFNYREDSIRQLAEAFTDPAFSKFNRAPATNLFVATMTRYEERLPTPVAFPADTVDNPLGAIIASAGKTQLRLAETYKYAHVTYFFNGYREIPYENEYRVLIPSLNVPHIDQHPEMMAAQISDRVLQALENKSFDFILANYANPDTIGHTGNYQAAIEAVKVIDREIGRLVKGALKNDALMVITADHGNVEQLINPFTAHQETQHDPNPVPFHIIANEYKNRKFSNYREINQPIGILADVAPTILGLIGIAKPEEMTGRDLRDEIS